MLALARCNDRLRFVRTPQEAQWHAWCASKRVFTISHVVCQTARSQLDSSPRRTDTDSMVSPTEFSHIRIQELTFRRYIYPYNRCLGSAGTRREFGECRFRNVTSSQPSRVQQNDVWGGLSNRQGRMSMQKTVLKVRYGHIDTWNTSRGPEKLCVDCGTYGWARFSFAWARQKVGRCGQHSITELL
jgi:hypothetical protein